MKTRHGLLLGIVVAALYACAGSVSSSVPASATIFDPQLLGTWTDSATNERAVMTQAGPRTYAVQYTDGQGQTLSLIGLLGRAGGHFILDVQPTAPALGAYKDLVVRLHIPLILDTIGGRIHVATLERDSLDHYLRSHPRAVAHSRGRDGFVLTANSLALHQFLMSYIARPRVLSAATTWERRSP